MLNYQRVIHWRNGYGFQLYQFSSLATDRHVLGYPSVTHQHEIFRFFKDNVAAHGQRSVLRRTSGGHLRTGFLCFEESPKLDAQLLSAALSSQLSAAGFCGRAIQGPAESPKQMEAAAP